METSRKRTQKNGDFIAGKRYKRVRKISSGAFGRVYLGENTTTLEKVAIKMENSTTQLLENEYNVYCKIRDGIGIPNMQYYGKEGKYNALVMELLGPSIQDQFRFCENRFSVKTICLLAKQMLERIEFIHSKGFIHRDIKPENFVTGLKEEGRVIYLVDYGLTKPFKDIAREASIAQEAYESFYGTMAFASINALQSKPQSKRDDVEAIGYVLLYFCAGDLPWYSISHDSNDGLTKKVAEMKSRMSIIHLCPDMAEEFQEYFDYCKHLTFNDEPDYKYLRTIFKIRLNALNCRNFLFDWEPDTDWFLANLSKRNDEPVAKKKKQPKKKTKEQVTDTSDSKTLKVLWAR